MTASTRPKARISSSAITKRLMLTANLPMMPGADRAKFSPSKNARLTRSQPGALATRTARAPKKITVEMTAIATAPPRVRTRGPRRGGGEPAAESWSSGPLTAAPLLGDLRRVQEVGQPLLGDRVELAVLAHGKQRLVHALGERAVKVEHEAEVFLLLGIG